MAARGGTPCKGVGWRAIRALGRAALWVLPALCVEHLFQWDRRQAFERLVGRVNHDADGFQRGNAQ